jgi:hypothetical protein
MTKYKPISKIFASCLCKCKRFRLQRLNNQDFSPLAVKNPKLFLSPVVENAKIFASGGT